MKNSLKDPADFSYYENDPAAQEFRKVFKPAEIAMEYRLPKVEDSARQHGLTLNKIETGKLTFLSYSKPLL